MTILALDIGDRRIGVAISDEKESIPFPLDVIHRTNMEQDCAIIREHCRSHHARLIVAGLPRSFDGTLKTQAVKIQKYVDVLKTKVDIPVEYWDEWLTTKQSEAVLISADVSRTKRKQVIDKMAATLILEGYLSRKQRDRKSAQETESQE